MVKLKAGVLVGSLRRESFNKKISQALIALAPETLSLEPVEIGGLPLFNEDLDNDSPPLAWVEFRKKMQLVDCALFVTPEYNRSVPGVLKNAIDVGSRPYGKSIWDGKPAAVISVSPGRIGGFGANHHLRQSLVFLNVPTMQQPEAYIGEVAKLFDAPGGALDEATKRHLKTFIDGFAVWAGRNTNRRL